MKNVLVTGATGNVGSELIKVLSKIKHNLTLFAGVRNLKEDASKINDKNIQLIKFDFTDITTYQSALKNCDTLFC